jgi:phage terminase large subunit-like protein
VIVARTRGGAVEKFFSAYLRHTKGARAGEPFLLEPWEAEFVREFYRVDDRGDRLYRLGILGIPRGNGKSPLAAGFGLYETMTRSDAPDVYCTSGSRDQAQVVMDYARSFVDAGELASMLQAARRSVTFPDNGGVMRVLSAAGALQHGLIPSAVIADELHAYTTEAQEELWNAMWTALHKRPNAFAVVITTAGFNKNTLLGRMYDDALKYADGEDRGPCLRIRRDLENGVLFWWYGLPEDLHDDWENEAYWKPCNPASWVTVDQLRRQLRAPGVDELDFKRLHLNAWTAARDSWLPSGVWTRLGPRIEDGEPVVLEIPDGADVYVGVDVGWSHDSTAVVWAAYVDEKIVLRAHVWTTAPDRKGEEYVPGGSMRLELVEEFIRSLARRYRVREVAFDPNYFGRSAQLLEEDGIVAVQMDPSSGPMVHAWQGFYQAAMEGTISHDGDRVLANHVEAAAADKTERGWRVRKLRSTSRIDALAAAVMAHERCRIAGDQSGPPQIFWLDV